MVATRPTRRSRWQTGLNVLAQVFLALWLLLVVNSWAFKHSHRVDLTREKIHELDSGTIELLEGLPRPVEVVIPFSNQTDERAVLFQKVLDRAVRTCEEFQLVNPGFRLVSAVDILRDPTGWEQIKSQYEIDSPDAIYLFSGERREVVLPTDLAQFQLPTAQNPNVQPALVAERVAEALATAIKRVLTDERPRVLITQGSGEVSLENPRVQWSLRSFQGSLGARGYEVFAHDLRLEPEIPENTSLVVLVCAGPDGFDPLRGERRDAIQRYLDSGGSLMVFLPVRGASGLEPLLQEFGITAGDSHVAIVGPEPGRRRGPTTFLMTSLVNSVHEACRGLEWGSFEAELRLYRPLHLDPEGDALALLSSPQESWLESDYRYLRRDAQDSVGSFPLIAAAESTSGARVVVFGSWSSVLDPQPRAPAGFFRTGARRLILNTTHWLVRDPVPEAGGGRELGAERMVLNDRFVFAIRWMALLVLPACAILAGLLAFWIRRS